MRKKEILISIFLILICCLTTGCSEGPDFTAVDYVEEDLSGSTKPTEEVFNGVIQNGWVYYSNYADNQKIYRIKTNGTEKTKLGNHKSCSVIDVLDGWIYYNDRSTGYDSIFKMRTSGKDKTKIFGGNRSKGQCANGFKIIGNWIYYTNWYDMYSINRVKLDGSDAAKLSNETYNTVAIDNNLIYYIDYFDRRLYRMTLDGTEKTKLYDNETYSFEIADGYIYCLNASDENNDGGLYRIDSDGSDKTRITEKSFTNFIISDGWIYYDGNQLGKMRLDGSEDTTYIEHNYFSGHIWVTGDWMYFRSVNEHDHQIFREKIK